MRLSPKMFWNMALAAAAQPVVADTTSHDAARHGGVLMVQSAPGVLHFSPNPEHTDHAWLVGAEWLLASRWLAGYAYFNNSFDQKSHYLYGGRWWPVSKNNPRWYLKLTAGVIAGYKEPYQDKIPYNHNGIAPGIVPAVGYKMNRFNIQLNLVGPALMLTVGYDLIR